VQQGDNERHLERSAASATFLRNFENCNGLPTRTFHRERCSALDKEYVDYYLGRLNPFSNDYQPELAFSMDGTYWRFFEAPRKVVAEKGSDPVKLQSKNGEKTSFTALRAMSCAGEKLPLWVLAKCWTVRGAQKYGSHPTVKFTSSENG
jgi:hypothetical protein